MCVSGEVRDSDVSDKDGDGRAVPCIAVCLSKAGRVSFLAAFDAVNVLFSGGHVGLLGGAFYKRSACGPFTVGGRGVSDARWCRLYLTGTRRKVFCKT